MRSTVTWDLLTTPAFRVTSSPLKTEKWRFLPSASLSNSSPTHASWSAPPPGSSLATQAAVFALLTLERQSTILMRIFGVRDAMLGALLIAAGTQAERRRMVLVGLAVDGMDVFGELGGVWSGGAGAGSRGDVGGRGGDFGGIGVDGEDGLNLARGGRWWEARGEERS
jgi:uncharacterized membrane protein YgcG